MYLVFVVKSLIFVHLSLGLLPKRYIIVAEHCNVEYTVCLDACIGTSETESCLYKCENEKEYCLELFEESE